MNQVDLSVSVTAEDTSRLRATWQLPDPGDHPLVATRWDEVHKTPAYEVSRALTYVKRPSRATSIIRTSHSEGAARG